ncbi:hypothetical protein KIN20_023012 [Parelaphostrongylus tenuis]|uniref:Uncharacterized protein n=1 Tax=Parelaphostrongylus tenuis TaxID=148309 RepID=A0AAD5MR26_PARTN|nr:hypothetical protein KIN20_023012 [Parelaphostrongylus tenuis]
MSVATHVKTPCHKEDSLTLGADQFLRASRSLRWLNSYQAYTMICGVLTIYHLQASAQEWKV